LLFPFLRFVRVLIFTVSDKFVIRYIIYIHFDESASPFYPLCVDAVCVYVVVVSLDFYNIYVQVRVMLFDDPFIVFVNLCIPTCYTRPCFTYCRHYGDRKAILYANFLTQFSVLWLTAIPSIGVKVRDLFIFSLFEQKKLCRVSMRHFKYT
jgi:hypothetical protein